MAFNEEKHIQTLVNLYRAGLYKYFSIPYFKRRLKDM